MGRGDGVGCTGFASIIADFARNGVCIAEKNVDERTKERLSARAAVPWSFLARRKAFEPGFSSRYALAPFLRKGRRDDNIKRRP
jgi:hypothetical protein